MSPTWQYWPAAWTPSNLGSLRAWYDASDTSTVTESSNLITAWNDKSGGGYHLSASGGDRPTYTSSGLDGKHVVTFGGSQSLAAATASDWNFLHQSGGSTVVAVWKVGTSADPNAAYSLLGNLNDSPNTHGFSIQYDDRANIGGGRNDQLRSGITRGSSPLTSNNFTANDAHPANTPTIVSVTSDPGNTTASDRSSVRINGGTATEANTQTETASTSTATSPIRLGNAATALPLTGYIAEVVIANAKLSDADRERVEGYLAHKWGLEGNLPGGHPFKNGPPPA